MYPKYGRIVRSIVECLPKTFGLNCLQSCGNCFNDSCSAVNGTCLQGCASGYSDSLCKTCMYMNTPACFPTKQLIQSYKYSSTFFASVTNR